MEREQQDDVAIAVVRPVLSGEQDAESDSRPEVRTDDDTDDGQTETLTTRNEAVDEDHQYDLDEDHQYDLDDDDDSECCSICLEAWTNSGTHRLSSLKCGHLFGHSCIVRWLKGQRAKCPQCNRKARKADIRIIYAQTVRTLDTCERDAALKALEAERAARRRAETEAAEARLRCEMLAADCSTLREALSSRQQQGEMAQSRLGVPAPLSRDHSSDSQQSQTARRKFVLEKSLTIWEKGGCRVMSYCHQLAALCVSQPSASPLFAGYGFKKLSCLDMRTSQYIAAHSKPVRDLVFNTDGLLLTASMDRTVAICKTHTGTVVQRYACAAPVWSCAWSERDPTQFYAGLQSGVVCVYDVRQTSGHVRQLNTDASRSPVVALHCLTRKFGGILVGQLDRTSFYGTEDGETYQPHVLPHQGNLTSLHVDEHSSYVLASYRPSVTCPHVQYQVYELVKSDADDASPSRVTCRHVRTLHGGATQKLLSRSRLLRLPTEGSTGELVVCAADEAAMAVQTWDLTTGRRLQTLPSPSPVLDLCPLVRNNADLLVALTEKHLLVHQWQ